MKTIEIKPIGTIRQGEDGAVLALDSKYAQALRELDGFSHINVIWWCDKCDTDEGRSMLEVEAPYKNAPEIMGIFATRSPLRPNPVALTAVQVIHIDHTNATLQLAYIDADDGTPVLDIKPYTPSIDRIENPEVPEWCGHWPRSAEESGAFDWSAEFNF